MQLFLVASLAALASSFAQADTVFHPLIVGGETVPPATKTYMVGLRDTKDGMSYCGGALITPKHVLTAAHCAKSAYKFAAVGTHYLEGTQDGEQLKIASFKLHPQYNLSTLSYDLAVLTLASASKFTPVSLSASDYTPFIGKTGTAMGWGTLSDEAEASPELLRVDLKVLTQKDCLGAGLFREPDATMFCAGGKYWKDTCSGDSGGPFVIEDKKNPAGDVVVGVVSWGDIGSCGTKGKPGVYAQVAKGADFIKAAAPGVKFVRSHLEAVAVGPLLGQLAARAVDRQRTPASRVVERRRAVECRDETAAVRNVQSKLNYHSPYRTGRACMARMEKLLSMVRDERNPQRRKVDEHQLGILKVIDILDKQTRATVNSEQPTSSSSRTEMMAVTSTQPVVSSQVSLRIPVRKPPQRGSIAFLLASIPGPPTSDDDAEMEDKSEDELLDFVGVGPLSPAPPSSRSANEANEARVRPMSNCSRRLRDETTRGSEIIVLSDSDSSSDEHDGRAQDGHCYRRSVRPPEFFTPMMASHSISSVRGEKRKGRADEIRRPSKAAKTTTVSSPRRPSASESSQLQEMREEIAMLRAHITDREQAHEVEIDTLCTMLSEERQAYRNSRTQLVDAFEGERSERRDDFMQMMSVVTEAVLPPLSTMLFPSQ